MTCAEKVVELRRKIETALTPLINRNYWLLEVPYYDNIGDTLIWQGEMDFLEQIPHMCLGMHSQESFPMKGLERGGLVLFQGGGNFGDLWVDHHDFRKRVMKAFPECRYVILPQTVYYRDERRAFEDAAFFSHYNVTICVRDKDSYDYLSRRFSNEIKIVPDMAFCMDMTKWKITSSRERDLLLCRKDAEFKSSQRIEELKKSGTVDCRDWPTMWIKTRHERIMDWLKRHRGRGRPLLDFYGHRFYRPYLIRAGIALLSVYERIYTTRFHGAILGMLLGKDVEFLDNSYGKNRNFYNTWLDDCDAVRMV